MTRNSEQLEGSDTYELHSSQEDFVNIMKAIEEENECSGGFCSSNVDSFLPIYVFSNINDGLP